MRDQRKQVTGIVTSDKMDKTVVVAVTATKRHPMYGKTIKVTKKYKAHDEANECKMGDLVRIIESKPMSRHKRFAIVSIVERAK